MKTILVALLVICPTFLDLQAAPQGRVSSPTVLLRLGVADHDTVVMRIPDGRIGTVTVPSERQIGLMPNFDGKELEIRVLRTNTGAEAEDAWTEARTFRLSQAAGVTFEDDDLSISIEWLGLVDAESQPDSSVQCCVTCQEVRYCGCAVETVCADCCASQCCARSTEAARAVATPETRPYCKRPEQPTSTPPDVRKLESQHVVEIR